MNGEPSLKDLRRVVNRKVVDYAAAKQNFTQAQRELMALTDDATDAEEAQKVLQLVAQTVQQSAHKRIAGVVSRCLEAVFDEPYDFRIIFEQKRGRTEARLVFVREEMEVDPLTASGGGVVDVAAFALRLSCLMLTRPSLRKILLLDEPFRFVSSGYRERVRNMLENLSKDLGVQIIMVTHMDELKTGNIIQL